MSGAGDANHPTLILIINIVGWGWGKPLPNNRHHPLDVGSRQEGAELTNPVAVAVGGGSSSQWWSWTICSPLCNRWTECLGHKVACCRKRGLGDASRRSREFETCLTIPSWLVWRDIFMGRYGLNSCFELLTCLQVVAVSWTQHVGNTFSTKQTQAQLIECLSSFILKSIKLSQARRFQTYAMVGEDLQEIREIVHILTDMLSNPLSLRHLCRVQIRRSLGRDFRRKLNQLNIPLPLQEYLRIYKQSGILLWFPGQIWFW